MQVSWPHPRRGLHRHRQADKVGGVHPGLILRYVLIALTEEMRNQTALDKNSKLQVGLSALFAVLLFGEHIRECALVSALDQPELEAQCPSEPQESRKTHIAFGRGFHARERDAGNARPLSELFLGEPFLKPRLLQRLPHFSQTLHGHIPKASIEASR